MVQFLSVVFQKALHAVNCHATTETSDLIGGLRPVRGRDSIRDKILLKVKKLICDWPHKQLLESIELPDYLAAFISTDATMAGNDEMKTSLESDIDVDTLLSAARAVCSARPKAEDSKPNTERSQKRRKLEGSLPTMDKSMDEISADSLQAT